MGSKMRTITAQIFKNKIPVSQNDTIFSMLSILKTLTFSLVGDALKSLIYHRPVGEDSNFSSVLFMSDDGSEINSKYNIHLSFIIVVRFPS